LEDCVAKFKDYYRVLGIPPRAHHRVIEESYWEQAHELHAQPTRKAAQRLRAINEAYETLASPHRRMEYDRRWVRESRDSRRIDDVGSVGFFQIFVQLLAKPFRPD
jgi:curved DNA-binding protein CbpA